MQTAVLEWLDRIASTAFTYSAWTFVLLNGFAIAMVAWKRDPQVVNRWTSRFLAANLLLIGTGLGVPVVSMAMRSAIVSLSSVMHVHPAWSEKRDADAGRAATQEP